MRVKIRPYRVSQYGYTKRLAINAMGAVILEKQMRVMRPICAVGAKICTLRCIENNIIYFLLAHEMMRILGLILFVISVYVIYNNLFYY